MPSAKSDSVVTATNHSAGINGGITNGMLLVFTPPLSSRRPSIYKGKGRWITCKTGRAPLIQGRRGPASCLAPPSSRPAPPRWLWAITVTAPLWHRMDGAAHQRRRTVMEYGLIGSK